MAGTTEREFFLGSWPLFCGHKLSASILFCGSHSGTKGLGKQQPAKKQSTG